MRFESTRGVLQLKRKGLSKLERDLSEKVSKKREFSAKRALSKLFGLFYDKSDAVTVLSTPKFWGRLVGIGLVVFGSFNLIAPPSSFPGVNIGIIQKMSISAVFVGVLFLVMNWQRWTRNSQFVLFSVVYSSGLALFGLGYGKIYGPVELQLLAPIASVWVGLTQPRFRSLYLAPLIIIDETLPSIYYKVPIARFFVGSLLTTAAFVVMSELISLLIGQLRRTEEKAMAAAEESATLAEIARSAEREQRDKAMEMTVVFDASGDIISVVDLDRKLVRVSGAAEKILGLDTNFKAGEDIALNGAIHEDDLGTFLDTLMMLKEGKLEMARLKFRLRNTLAQGERVTIAEATLRPLFDHEGRLKSFVMVVRDVTESERIQVELKEAVKRADSANAAKTEFLARMSHELRTPLNSILGFGQLLQSDDLDAIQKDSVDRIVTAGRHLLALINDVLDLAKVEAGHTTLELEEIEILEIVRDAASLIRPIASAAGLDLNVRDFENNNGFVIIGDKNRLKQVLINLLSNAVKYNSEKGSITMSVDATGEKVKVSVKDTGKGIAKEDFQRVFIPFDRLGSEHTAIEGTGIGLSLSKQLVEAMGGTLGFESELGSGTTFNMTFSISKVVKNSAPKTASFKKHSGFAFEDSDRKILYVEDNEANTHLMKRIFLSWPHLKLDCAATGNEGLRLIGENAYEIILLDLELPDISGLEVLRTLKDDEATRDIPVIMVSASAMQKDIDELNSVGAFAYLTKPIDISELEEVIKGALQPTS